MLHEQARSLVRPLKSINLSARFKAFSSEPTDDFDTGLLKSLKSTQNVRPRNITHLAVLYALHTSRVLPKTTSVALHFYWPVLKSVSYAFNKKSGEPRNID